MGRIKAREGLVSLMFQETFNNDYSEESLELFLENSDYDEIDSEFIKSSYYGIVDNLNEIDEKINSNLKKWDINRLFKIDLSILRVAFFELLYDKNIPKEIVINEAVEIAKKFSSQDSAKFINGVLGSFVRSDEMA